MIERDALPEDQRRFHDAVKAIRRHPISGPFIVALNGSPDLATRFAHLGHYFHARGQADESVVPIRLRAYVSLVGSRALDAPYEWAAWVNWALQAGVPQQIVDAIREGRRPSGLTEDEALVDRFVAELVGNARVGDATFAQALERLGARGVVELVVTLGYFAMIALPLNAFEIEMAPAQMALRKPFAPLLVGGRPWDATSTASRPHSPLVRGERKPRLPLLTTHDDLAPAEQHFLDRVVRTRGWVAPIYQVLLHSPDVAERIASIGEIFLYQSLVPAPTKALAWLVTARALDCAYTWFAGVDAARRSGLDSGLVDALGRDAEADRITREQRDIAAYCGQLLRGNHHVSVAVYRAALEQLGVPALVHLTTAVGYVAMMSLIANALDVEPVAEKESRPAL
jgi:4-carboxymuconolactone decarboxylase